MTLLLVSFIAGVLTILAPCVLPLLPVIIGGTLADSNKKPSPYRPLVIAASLSVSIIIFTLLLKATTSFISIPDLVWQLVSGLILLFVGLYFLYPRWWYTLPVVNSSNQISNRILGKTLKKSGLGSAVLIGGALGPVFNSCSPTYALIVAGVLPVSFAEGFIYLIAYVIGLSGTLLVIAYAGQSTIQKFYKTIQPHGVLMKLIGVSFIVVGICITIGIDKDIQAFILEQGWYDPVGRFEESLNKL